MAQTYLERINTVWFTVLGVTVLAAGLLIYLLLLESVIGNFSIHEAAPRRAFEAVYTPKVALLNSDYTRHVNHLLNPRDSSRWVDRTLNSWRGFLLDPTRHLRYDDLTDAQLERGELDAYNVLILPSVRALSDGQIKHIKHFMAGGGNVLATWTPGVYRPDGSWRGWTFSEEVFGVSFKGFVDRNAGNYRIYSDTFPGVTPSGMYFPERLPATNFHPDTLQARIRRQADRARFAPLSGYRWADTLNATPPFSDFATAESKPLPLRDLDGKLRRQQAVVTTYYTWMGGKPEDYIPYPNTGPGIRRFTLRANTPLTAHLDPGYRVKLQVYNPGVRMRVAEPRSHAAGFWFDFAAEDRVVGDAINQTTGLVYGTYGSGRFVYMGFQRDALGTGPDDREDGASLGQFFTNIVHYLRREPVAWVHDWPASYHGAAVLAGTGNGLIDAADMLDAEGVRATFFVRPEIAVRRPDTLRRLARSGEIGILDNVLNAHDGSIDFQTNRLTALREQLDSLGVGDSVIGYRPDRRGRTARGTMEALQAAGYRYFLPDSVGRRISPKIMGEPIERLTRLGYTVRSDRELWARSGNSTDLWRDLLQGDIDRVRYEGGLYRLVFHDDGLGSPENVEILRGLIRTLKTKGFWITTAGDMVHWWRLHRGLNVNVEQRGPARLFVRVSNDNGAIAEQTAVSIALGQPVGAVNVRPELLTFYGASAGEIPECQITGDNSAGPESGCRLEDGGRTLVMTINRLKPQQYRIFHIDLLQSDGLPLNATD